jgi:AraC-like DNA-binding protein
MQNTQATSTVPQDGLLASQFVARSDVAALARLLNDLSTTLNLDPATAGGVLARANVMVASILQAGTDPKQQETAEGRMAPWQARRVRAQIEQNLNVTLPVRQLAEAVRLSKSHFSRTFRATFGCSPHAYILQRRIERAKALIRDTAEPLVQIALECGLTDQAHLSRIFRRHVGCTPSTWRRNARA